MSSSRMGKRDIFSRPSGHEPAVAQAQTPPVAVVPTTGSHPARGRPKEHTEGWTKVTVILLDRQIHWLDKLAADIRLNTKCAVSRAEILRAMVSAIEESGLDLSRATSDTELRALIAQALRADVS